MRAQPLALLIICFIALFSSFIYSFFYPTVSPFINLPLTIITIIFFLFGVIGFGFLSFLPHIFLGLNLGATKNALIFLYLLPISIATYAGIKFGFLIQQDFEKKEYFLDKSKIIVYLIIFAILISLAIEFLQPIIFNLDIWPKDLLGLNIQETDTKSLFDILRQR